MRTYGQYCALAKSLDVLGDRWTLLIVRELMLAGPSRYTDLRNGLPGIATNLLSERLRELEAAGVVARNEAPPPVATTLFSLTERGEALALDGAAPFDPMGNGRRSDKVMLPESMMKEPTELRRWLLRAFTAASALAPKVAARTQRAAAKKKR